MHIRYSIWCLLRASIDQHACQLTTFHIYSAFTGGLTVSVLCILTLYCMFQDLPKIFYFIYKAKFSCQTLLNTIRRQSRCTDPRSISYFIYHVMCLHFHLAFCIRSKLSIWYYYKVHFVQKHRHESLPLNIYFFNLWVQFCKNILA